MAWDDLAEHDGETEGEAGGEVIVANGHVAATGGVDEDPQHHQNGLYDPQVVVVANGLKDSDMKDNIDSRDHNGLRPCTMTKSSISESEDHIRIKDVPFWSSCRVGLAILGFLGFINVYAVRVNLSVAIVCMVNQTYAHGDDTGVTTDTECSDTRNGTDTSNLDTLEGKLNWDKTLQGTILGSFFWGYLVPQIPAGWLAIKFGGKRVYGIAMILASIATLFTPLLANTHYIALIVLRILLGCFTGVAFPSMHAMWGQWAPPLERSKLLAFTYAGAQVGIVVTFPLSGFLCKYGFAGGWPSIFYITGGVSLLWSCLWMFVVSDSPRTHKSISDIERDYILQSLKQGSVENKKNIKVPWKSILTSLPVYAIIVANISSDWGAYTLLTNIPTYINSVLKFDITSNGLVSALPYIAFWFVINIGGVLADFLRKRNMLSTAATRKVFTSFGMVVPAVMLVALGYVDCSQPALAIGLLIFAISLTGAQYSGFLINHVEIAPDLAGILFGLSNSVASVTGFLSSLIVGVITENDPTRTGWQIVFYIAAGIYVLGAIVFTVFSSGELQPWAQTTECQQQETLEDVDGADDGPAGEGMKMIDQTKTIV